MLGHQGEFSTAFALARQALPLLPAEERKWRGLCLSVLATEAVLSGQLDQADALLTSAQTFHQDTDDLTTTQFVRLLRGDMALCRGELEQAHFWFHQVLASANEQHELIQLQLTDGDGKRRAHFERLACYGLAALAFERNDLAEAQRCLQEASEVAQLVWLHVLTPGLLLSVRLLHALGEAELARTRLLELEASLPRPEMRREVHLCQAWLALAQGDTDGSARLCSETRAGWRAPGARAPGGGDLVACTPAHRRGPIQSAPWPSLRRCCRRRERPDACTGQCRSWS